MTCSATAAQVPFPYNATLDTITAFFHAVAPVNSVRLRRHIASKDFRGSVFVEFSAPEARDQVILPYWSGFMDWGFKAAACVSFG